jgi:hypothetical protein
VQEDQITDLLDLVGDIIQSVGQGVDLVTVKAGDKGCRQPGEDLPGDPVAFMLQVQQVLGLGLGISWVTEQVQQCFGGHGDVVGGRLKQGEVGVLLAREQAKLHAPLPREWSSPACWIQVWAASWMASQGLPKGGV